MATVITTQSETSHEARNPLTAAANDQEIIKPTRNKIRRLNFM
jgi:hypothetical protein